MSNPSRRSVVAIPLQDDDHVAGAQTAAVTLIAYCDFECPYCGDAFPTIKGPQAELQDRLYYVFRHFPLNEKHPFAQQAAEAAEAAGVQGQFWAMHDLLFEHQEALGDEDLYAYAATLDLDMERFEEELRRGVHASRVARDVQSGRRNGVTGTPTFFVNGVRHADEERLERLVFNMAERTSS